MRKLVLVSAVALLTVLAVLPSATQAVSGNLVATAGIPVKLYGDSTIKARDAALVVDTHHLPQLDVDGQLTLEKIRITSAYSPVTSGLSAPGERRVETTTHEIVGGLALASRQNDLVLVAQGSDADLTSSKEIPEELPSGELWTGANLQVGALLVPETFSVPVPELRTGQVESRDGRVEFPAQTYEASARDASATLAHLDSLLLYGGVLRADDGTTYESRNTKVDRPGSLFANGQWTGPGTHVEETVEYFIVRSDDAQLTIQAAALSLYSNDIFVAHDGFMGFPWAEGRVETTNESIALQGDQVILGGQFRLRPVGVDVTGVPQVTLLGDGDIDFVKVGVAEGVTPGQEALLVAGGTAAGLSLVAVAVYFWPTLKYALSLALFPLYARVRKEETLEHKGRELLYDLIKNEPGVSTNQLAKEVPFGWSTLTYHLRVLERNEAIVSVRDGRYKRFFDRTSGRYSNGRKFVLAVLKNDATFDIARFIKEKPGSSQKEVAGSFQLSPSSVHWHVERLSEVGLVQKIREAHNVKYFPGEGWDHITVEDLKALAEPATTPPGELDAGAAAPTTVVPLVSAPATPPPSPNPAPQS